MSNQLKNERSPYLKQHEDNPVEWFAWDKISLDKAKRDRKPIFLSVGYSSCHWCHVMAHESFENIETAKIMNDKFVNIKVDREERPDLDTIFQKSLSILTGAQGGWPLSMFLDENGVPFTGGTYFPPKEIQGRPSFNQVLLNVSKVYEENREKIISQVSQLQAVFKDLNRKNSVLRQDLQPYAEKIIQYLDLKNGGFQGAPKFPQFYIFQTLFYFFNINNNSNFLKPVQTLLMKVSSRGIYDHLSGGISRYTVDEKWIIPHFEKMLYDNIQYVLLLTHYLSKFNSNYLTNKLKQTINFINTEFKTEEDLLGSALDADSNGIEGKYYTWEYKDLEKILQDKFQIFKKNYDITENGNFEGMNILIEKNDTDLKVEDLEKLEGAKNILKKERDKRDKPFFDTKIQTDLNCFWLYSNLYSSILLKDFDLYKNTISLSKKLIHKLEKNIYHCYEKDNKNDVFLEDYSYLCLLLITLYELENDKEALKFCQKLMIESWEFFFNKQYNLLQKNISKNNDLFVDPIEINDNNLPNGNSIYLFVCNKLNNITNDNGWLNKKDLLSKTFHSYINYNFSQMFSFIKALNICEKNITITFNGNYENYENLIKQIDINLLTESTIIHRKNKDETFVIICQNQTCSKKLKNIDEIRNYLKNIHNV